MTITTKSFVYRWTYLLSASRLEGREIYVTDLCTLFWRSVLWTPAQLLLLGALVSSLLALTIKNIEPILVGIGILILLLVPIFLLVALILFVRDTAVAKSMVLRASRTKNSLCQIVFVIEAE